MAEAPSARQAFEQQLTYDLSRLQSYRIQGNFMRGREENTMDVKEPPKELNPFNMTAKNFPKKRNHIRSNYNRTRGGTVNAAKALELVRTALQPTLNKEIEQVLKSYQEIFRMAAINIKDNTGETVTEEHINSVLRKSLDEAKTLFRIDTRSLPEKMKYERGDRGASPSVIRRKRQRLEAEKERAASPAKSIRHDPKHIIPEWDPDSINEDTEFIMGVKANKALGFAATRGKLYYRHPELFKYSGDSDDKQWLFEHNLLPITGGKAFLMIAEDIRTLVAQNSEYRDNENLELSDLQGFKVPMNMIEKMKAFMRRAAREAKREKERTAREGETDTSLAVKYEKAEQINKTNDEQKDNKSEVKTDPETMVKLEEDES